MPFSASDDRTAVNRSIADRSWKRLERPDWPTCRLSPKFPIRRKFDQTRWGGLEQNPAARVRQQ